MQMCWEEKFVGKYDIPALLTVGWEGFFGLLGMSTLILVIFFNSAAFGIGQVHCHCRLPAGAPEQLGRSGNTGAREGGLCSCPRVSVSSSSCGVSHLPSSRPPRVRCPLLLLV